MSQGVIVPASSPFDLRISAEKQPSKSTCDGNSGPPVCLPGRGGRDRRQARDSTLDRIFGGHFELVIVEDFCT